ncbi:GIN domain-containing protein [Bacteroidota bacterium]
MKRVILFIFVALLGINSCYQPTPGSGIVIEETRTLPVFNSINMAGTGVVYVSAGSPQSILIKTDDNFIHNIKTIVRNKKLTISTENNIAPTILDFYITIPDIAQLKVSGSGNIIVENSFNQGSTLWLIGEGSGNIAINQFNANDCHITNEGSGNISIISTSLNMGIILDNFGSGNIRIEDISASEVNAYVLGSGNITVESGSTNNNNLQSEGSGQIDIMGMSSATADVTNEGSGNIKLTVSDYLNAKIYGSGNIYYWGNPPNVDEYISGSGKLIRN